MERITEQPSRHDDLEQRDTRALLEAMNTEDRGVPVAVAAAGFRVE